MVAPIVCLFAMWMEVNIGLDWPDLKKSDVANFSKPRPICVSEQNVGVIKKP